ncbi:MAG: hypothetical protein NXI10_05460 [bacterium]|nr:hypothetical protein [bacterium]
MDKHTFKITISGTQKEAQQKAQAAAKLLAFLDAKTLDKLAYVAEFDKEKVALAKQFLGV